MSEMVTVQTCKPWTERVCQARRVESLDSNRQALKQESCFWRIIRHIRQAPSTLHQEFPGSEIHGAKLFIYSFVYLFIW